MKLSQSIATEHSGRRLARNRSTIWLITFIVFVFLLWSAFAKLDEIVRGSGKVVPATRNQVVQNLEGGIVREIFVTEGDEVSAGQIIVEMDQTRFESAFSELQDQALALTLKLARLDAERDMSVAFEIDPELERSAPEYAASEMQLYLARRDRLNDTVANLETSIELKLTEVEMLKSMAEQAAVPRIELVRAEQAAIEVQSRLDQVRTEFEATRAQEYAESLLKLRQVQEQMRSAEDQLQRTSVQSPINGIVNKVLATTLGGVVRPADPLVEILSLDDVLRVEGRVDPRDIGFVYVGMPATIKLTAYDFSIYGTLTGRVVHVGADTVTDENQREAVPYYEVFIALNETNLEGPGGIVEIRPGMQAQIELLSGQKTVLQYLLKPLLKASEALSER